MKWAKKTLLTVILILFIGNINLGLIFAGDSASASFSVSCYMPYYVTMPDGQKVLAENQQTKQETPITKEEKKGQTLEVENNLIQQQEEIVSEDNKEVMLITTVCAK